MTLDEVKSIIESVEPSLNTDVFIIACSFERNGRKLEIALTERLRKACRKGRVWKSKQFLTAFKNSEYGFDDQHARSPGGSDGIFLLTREHRPKNEMMRRIFDRFLDKEKSGAELIAQKLRVSIKDLLPVRLVSHHMRLLGVLNRTENRDIFVLVDYDDTK